MSGSVSKDRDSSGGTAATAVLKADPTVGSEAAANRRGKEGHGEPLSGSGGVESTAALYRTPLKQFSAPVVKTKADRQDAPAADLAGGGGGEIAGASEGGGKEEEGAGEAWRMDRKLENDLLKLFGQADQVDAAFKVQYC